MFYFQISEMYRKEEAYMGEHNAAAAEAPSTQTVYAGRDTLLASCFIPSPDL